MGQGGVKHAERRITQWLQIHKENTADSHPVYLHHDILATPLKVSSNTRKPKKYWSNAGLFTAVKLET